MKLEFSRHISEGYSNIKFNNNPSSGSRVVPSGLTDRRTDGQKNRREEAKSSFSQYCERVLKTM